MKKNILLLTILTVLICFGCNKEKEKNLPKTFDFGKVEGTTYKNNFFKFSITYPKGWSTLDKSELNTFAKEGIEDLVKDDNLKAQIEANEINVATLFSTIKKPKGQNVQFTPSMIINCENISHRGDDISAEDYLEQAKKLMKQANMVIDITPKQKTKLGGVAFANALIENKTMETAITQDYYVTVINGFALNIISSYINKEQKTTLDNSLKTLIFN